MKPEFEVWLSDVDEDGRRDMEVRRCGVAVFSGADGGEPEDNLFGRDWAWVKPAIEAAYLYGFSDGVAARKKEDA